MDTLFLAFDTETTGLGNFKSSPTDPCQPDIVQLAASLYDEAGNIYHEINVLVQPEKEVEPKAAETHGISQEVLDRCGISRRNALSMFHSLLRSTDVLVAHNLNFDSRVLQCAYHRENVRYDYFLSKMRFCTMLETTELCKLPNPRYPKKFKWPSLDEAYRHFVDPEGFDNAHDAMADVRACSAIHRRLLEMGHGSSAAAS